MRELNFKVWHIPSKTWKAKMWLFLSDGETPHFSQAKENSLCLDGDHDHPTPLEYSVSESYSLDYRNEYDRKNYVVCQSTGLKDSEGKEIYEGDIILTENNKKKEVKFRNGMFGVDCDYEYSGLISLNFSIFTKIVGNIYENPELLEK